MLNFLDLIQLLKLKQWAALALILILARQIQSGYFQGFRNYLGQIAFRKLWLILGTTAALCLVLIFFDQALQETVRRVAGHPFARFVTKLGEWIGRSVQPWAILSVGYFFCMWRKDRLSDTVFGAVLSGLLCSGAGHGLKYLCTRARPYAGTGPWAFFQGNPFGDNDSTFLSFPSGDVASVAGAAAFLALSVRPAFARLIFFLLPWITAFSRIALDRHWPTDTLFAMGLGLCSAWFWLDFLVPLPKVPGS